VCCRRSFDKRGMPPPPPIDRIGVFGVDRLAQRLLGERGVQTLHSATPSSTGGPSVTCSISLEFEVKREGALQVRCVRQIV
jgi:hypothetical protein